MSDIALEDLCLLIVDSEHKTAPKDPDGLHPLIRTTNLGRARADLTQAQRVNSEVHSLWTKRAVPVVDDLVLAREAPVGGIFRIPDGAEPVLGQRTVLLRPDPSVVDSRFLMYRLASDDMQARMTEMSTGSTVPHLNMADIRALPIPRIPLLSTQRRISMTLSAFDTLIEINQRRIELLEDLARSFYREWFVHFRFPGHENVDLVDSEIGRVPEGWEVKRAGEVFTVLGGGTPSKKRDEYWADGMIPWFTPSDLTRGKLRYVSASSAAITDFGLQKSSARKFPAGSVLMTSRATLGVLAISKVEATCNQGFIVIPPTPDIPSEFVHEWLRSSAADLERLATGATFKEITKGAFKRFPVLVPARDVLARFGLVVGPLSRMISSLEDASRKLMTTRDLLLPRLVTGQLDISDVDLGVLTPADPE